MQWGRGQVNLKGGVGNKGVGPHDKEEGSGETGEHLQLWGRVWMAD